MGQQRTLFLHIGAHKTGSTAIQAFLNTKDKKLAEAGWELFREMPNGGNSPEGNANTWLEYKGSGSSFSANLKHGFAERVSRGTLNKIVSSEEMFWIDDYEYLADLYQHLSNSFSRIIVCCYLRRQDAHLLSHFQQGYKFPKSAAPQFYERSLNIIPQHQPHFSRYLDYYHRLNSWASIVGDKNLIAKEYSREKLKNGDAVSDFLSLLPINLQNSEPAKRTNESLNNTQVILNYSLFNVRESLWYELGALKFTKSPLFRGHKMPKIGEFESLCILSHYKESNKKLKIFIPSLSQDWFEFDALAPSEEELQFTIDDYELAIKSLLTYYDNLSAIEFIKQKLNKHANLYLIIKRLKRLLRIN